jgi:hypothetical protein
MALNIFEQTLDTVPEQFHELYSLEGDKYKLTGIADLKTSADIAALSEALRKERADHAAVKITAKSYAELGDIDAIKSNLARIAELEAAQGAQFDENKVAEVAEARVKAIVRPLEAEKSTLQAQLAEKDALIKQYDIANKQRVIKDEVESALKKQKITPEFHETIHLLAEKLFTVNDDGKAITKEGVGCTPYLDPNTWLSERQPMTPYWWGVSQGGGAGGNQGSGNSADNPFNPKTLNATKQGELYRSNPAEARRLAAQHGITLP